LDLILSKNKLTKIPRIETAQNFHENQLKQIEYALKALLVKKILARYFGRFASYLEFSCEGHLVPHDYCPYKFFLGSLATLFWIKKSIH
jgi:hypothetical protein